MTRKQELEALAQEIERVRFITSGGARAALDALAERVKRTRYAESGSCIADHDRLDVGEVG